MLPEQKDGQCRITCNSGDQMLKIPLMTLCLTPFSLALGLPFVLLREATLLVVLLAVIHCYFYCRLISILIEMGEVKESF